jgi:hypothetical protein
MTSTKHAHKKKQTQTQKHTSRNICNLSSKFLKINTKPIIYKKYELHIKDITNKFANSQNHLLNDIFNIKNKNKHKYF